MYCTNRIDYCNALLYGVAYGDIRRLQSVLHAAVRLITGIQCYEHITRTLRDTLHWLPISQRITFKIAVIIIIIINEFHRDTSLTKTSGPLNQP